MKVKAESFSSLYYLLDLVSWKNKLYNFHLFCFCYWYCVFSQINPLLERPSVIFRFCFFLLEGH